jgi:hypothetical protein
VIIIIKMTVDAKLCTIGTNYNHNIPNLPGPGLVSTSPESRSNMDAMLALKHKPQVVVPHSEPSEHGKTTACTRKLVLAET